MTTVAHAKLAAACTQCGRLHEAEVDKPRPAKCLRCQHPLIWPAAKRAKAKTPKQLAAAEANGRHPALTGTTTPAGIAANDPDADQDAWANRQRATEFSRETERPSGSAPDPADGPGIDLDESPPDTGQVVQVGLDLVHVHPMNRRPDAAAVQALADSFKDAQVRQLQPILVRVPPKHWGLPADHVQIVFGERRFKAAKLAGWESIEARIRTDLDDASTLAMMAEENAKRQDLNPIERARLIEWLCQAIDKGGAGLTRELAAKRVGLASGSAASNLVRLLDLPKVWQERVAGGELPESFARLLLPYLPATKLLDQIDADYQKAMKGKHEWDRRDWEKRDELERHLEQMAEKHTRPIDQKEKIQYGYDQIGTYASHGRLFELTDQVRQSLDIVTLLVFGKPREVATNVKAFDKLQLPLVKAKHKGDLARQASSRSTGRTKTKSKGAKASQPPTAAQLAKAREAEDKRLAEAISVWRYNWLMGLVYRAIESTNHNGVRDRLLVWLAAGGCYDYWGDRAHVAIVETLKSYRVHPAASVEQLWANLGLVQGVGAEPALRACGTAVCRALLLSPEPIYTRGFDPMLPTAVIEDLAAMASIDVAHEWEQLQSRTKAETAKLTSFFDLFTADQLDTLGEELGVYLGLAKGRPAKIKLLTTYASPTNTRWLPLPKALRPLPVAAGKERRPKVSKRGKGQ